MAKTKELSRDMRERIIEHYKERQGYQKISKEMNLALNTVGNIIIKYKNVEKRKISYFVLARNLIQHWISPNQDDLSYSAWTFISG